MVYVDTSAFLAVLDASDQCHPRAARVWRELLQSGVSLACSSYALVETCALIQRRLGMEALRAFREDVYPILTVFWVDARTHESAADAVLAANRRELSLVHCVSFLVMRQNGLKKVFTFDRHYVEQGFEVLG
ncbi:MAG: type II toxin-antitoxin system VapC family toxin [Firmicutes bacterium]|nr:type II toxin-antitoxin system VapC family toxin [Candidatus Fermentithermobacillaceae bacterium]